MGRAFGDGSGSWRMFWRDGDGDTGVVSVLLLLLLSLVVVL